MVEDTHRLYVEGNDTEDSVLQRSSPDSVEGRFTMLGTPGSQLTPVFSLTSQGDLNGMEFEGYFIDAGTPPAWMDGVRTCIEQSRFQTGSILHSSWFENVESASINNSKHRNSMFQKNVSMIDSEIISTTLLSGAKISSRTKLKNCLIGENAVILEGAELDGVVVDHGAQVPANHFQVGGQWPPN